jgi:prepilin-type N-terminal cleavage/methylation domain-containing protein
MRRAGSCQSQIPGGRSAFTLIELLVVVAIIAILLAILLPGLQAAREQTRDVVCKSNMRSIGQAFEMYAQEYGGVWPAAVDSMGQQNRWPVPFFEGGIITQEFNVYDETGALIQDGGKSIFLCPSEKAPRAIRDWRGTGMTVDRVEVGGSYAYSGEVHRDGGQLRLGTPSTPPFLRPVERCSRPSEVIALMDNFQPIETVSDPGWRYYRDTFFYGYRTISGDPIPEGINADRFKVIGDRHFGNLNALALDTHVEAYDPEQIRYDQVSWERWDGYPELPPGGQ